MRLQPAGRGAGNPLRAALDWLARSPGRAFLVIFVVSFSIQGFFLTKVAERYIRPHTRWEQQAIAVSLAKDNTLIVWETDTGAERFTLADHPAEVWGCNLSADGSTIAPAPQAIWRLPTVAEAVRSMARHGQNSAGVWEAESMWSGV